MHAVDFTRRLSYAVVFSSLVAALIFAVTG
jgi:hypothetical protein